MLAGSLLLGACSGGDDDADATASMTATMTATATETAGGSMTPMPSETAMGDMTLSSDTGAAELRAGLTHLLQEHVYLAANATHAAVEAGAAPVYAVLAVKTPLAAPAEAVP